MTAKSTYTQVTDERIKESYRRVRIALSEMGVLELVTAGSFSDGRGRTFDAEIYEAIHHVPSSIIYDLDKNKIENEAEITQVVDDHTPTWYMLGKPVVAFGGAGYHEPVHIFPVSFFRASVN